MKALQIDFAPGSLVRTLARTSALTWSAASIGLLACVLAAFNADMLMAQHAHSRTALQQVHALQQRRMAPVPASQRAALPAAQVDAINGTIARLNLPWRDVFDAIESATPPAIALLALEPDARRHLLKVTAEAKNSEAMIGYLDALQQQPLFAGVVLLRHDTSEQDPNKPLRFQFEAQWQAFGP